MNQVICDFGDIAERDMDILFLEEFACSGEFLKLFTDGIGIKDACVTALYASKTDVLLGESDLTVVIEAYGQKIGLLIEDKIDAIAMPNQADRYFKRGEKGILNGEYDKYYVFIVAPQKYLDQNSEAQKYPYRISYEQILRYFEQFDDPRSAFKICQIKQAIEKQKHGYQVEKDTAVTAFWSEYDDYQKKYYPELKLLYKKGDKGAKAAWPRFNTVFDGLYMYHKTNAGYVDLTFERCADKTVLISELVTRHLGDYHQKDFSIHKTGKSAALRLCVPVIDMRKPFEEQEESVGECFKAIRKMTDTVKLFSLKDIRELLDPGNF